MPSPIAMDAINAIIVRCQSAHERSPSNAMRKAVVISLKATRRPCWRTWQGHCEGIVSITMILIPRQQILPQGCQLPQHVHHKRKLWRFFQPAQESRVICSTQRRQLSLLSTWPMRTTTTSASNNKKTKPLWHVCHASCMQQSLDKQQIKSPGRASDTVFNDERTSASNNNKEYHFVGTPKIKRMLVVQCSGPTTTTSRWVQSAKIILDGFLRRGCLDL